MWPLLSDGTMLALNSCGTQHRTGAVATAFNYRKVQVQPGLEPPLVSHRYLNAAATARVPCLIGIWVMKKGGVRKSPHPLFEAERGETVHGRLPVRFLELDIAGRYKSAAD